MRVEIEVADSLASSLRDLFPGTTVEQLCVQAIQELVQRAGTDVEVNLHVSAIIDEIRGNNHEPLDIFEVIRVLKQRPSESAYHNGYTIDPRIEQAFKVRGGTIKGADAKRGWFYPPASESTEPRR